MLAKLTLILCLLVFSVSAHAEYYIVTPCQNCDAQTVIHKVHRTKRHMVHHAKRHVVRHHAPCRKVIVRHYHEPECSSGYCANGRYVRSNTYNEFKHEYFPHQRDRHFDYNYDDYNADLATGDDDTYKHPDMLIN